MRVLVVEDEKKTASFVRKALQSEGFAVDVCANGGEALAAPSATPYGLSIAQWIVTSHNGTIQIESSPQKLTTVTVCLPLLSNSSTLRAPNDKTVIKP